MRFKYLSLFIPLIAISLIAACTPGGITADLFDESGSSGIEADDAGTGSSPEGAGASGAEGDIGGVSGSAGSGEGGETSPGASGSGTDDPLPSVSFQVPIFSVKPTLSATPIVGTQQDDDDFKVPNVNMKVEEPEMQASKIKMPNVILAPEALSAVTVIRYDDQGNIVSSREYALSYKKNSTTIMMTQSDGGWSRREYDFRSDGKLLSVGMLPYILRADGTKEYIKDDAGLSDDELDQIEYYQLISFFPLGSDAEMQVTIRREGQAYRQFNSSPLDFAAPEESSGPESIAGNKELKAYLNQYASHFGFSDDAKVFRRRVVQSNWDENKGWVEQPVKLDFFSGGADVVSSRPFLYLRVDPTKESWTYQPLSELTLSSETAAQGQNAYPPLMLAFNIYGYHVANCGAGKNFWVDGGMVSNNFSGSGSCDSQKYEMCGTVIDVTQDLCSWDKSTGLITPVQDEVVKNVGIETERDASGRLIGEKLVDLDTGHVVEQHSFQYGSSAHKEKLPPPAISIPALGFETSVFMRDRMQDVLEPNGLGLIRVDGFQDGLMH